MRMTRYAAALILALAVLMAPTSAGAADTTSSTVQERVDEVIDEYGGEQTAWNEVTWEDGDIVLTLAPETTTTVSLRATVTATAADDCASGKYCVYSKTNYNGDKISYSKCPATYTSFTALSDSIHSIKNDRTSGTVKAYNGTTVKSTLAAGKGSTSVTSITKVTCA